MANDASGQVTGEHFCVDDSRRPRTGAALHMVEREQTWTPWTLEDQTHTPVPGRRGKLRNVSSLTG